VALLAPSILSADILQLADQIKIVEQHGADVIHIDVMDGRFVPNITFGPVIVDAVKRTSKLPADVHLMIVNPEDYIDKFAKSGAEYITVHQEACLHLDRTIQQIKDNGCKAGASLNPATPVSLLENILPELDLVLIMSVNPGFGGQSFIPYSLQKIADLVNLREKSGASFQIEVDGGINADTAETAVKAGADILVAGNAVFGQPSIKEACQNLKSLIS